MGTSPITIGVSTSLWGDNGYSQFVNRWWQGVRNLTRQPDAIVFVHDDINANLVNNSIPDQYRQITRTIELAGTYSDFMMTMQASQTTDWISVCNIDDEYLSGAFDQIEEADAAGCDIYIDKLRARHDNSVIQGIWNPQLIPTQMTCPGAAPIKRELFERAGGVTQGSLYDDWELYIRCVAVGAKPFHAETFRIIHDLGYDRVTLSGVNRKSENDEIGKAHIAKVRTELGL